LGFVAASLRALAGRTRSDDMVRLDSAHGATRTLTVNSRRSHLAVAVDGETVHLATPLQYQLRPAALQVIVPAATA
jgi:diacylglycerol kinase family enzyme